MSKKDDFILQGQDWLIIISLNPVHGKSKKKQLRASNFLLSESEFT